MRCDKILARNKSSSAKEPTRSCQKERPSSQIIPEKSWRWGGQSPISQRYYHEERILGRGIGSQMSGGTCVKRKKICAWLIFFPLTDQVDLLLKWKKNIWGWGTHWFVGIVEQERNSIGVLFVCWYCSSLSFCYSLWHHVLTFLAWFSPLVSPC